MAYSKQTWDTTSYVNPTRMNHIEDGIEANSWKSEEIVYSGLANDSSTGYYVMLDSNILTTLNATRILSATVIGFNGFGGVSGIIPNIVLDVDGSRATMPFIKGTIFSGASIKVRYIYE